MLPVVLGRGAGGVLAAPILAGGGRGLGHGAQEGHPREHLDIGANHVFAGGCSLPASVAVNPSTRVCSPFLGVFSAESLGHADNF